jgi:hypothetical protein
MGAGSAAHLVAFFELERQFPDQGFQPCILLRQASFAVTLFMDLTGCRGMGQKLVPPLIILGWAELMLVTEFRDGFPLEAFAHDQRLGCGIPCSSLHG